MKTVISCSSLAVVVCFSALLAFPQFALAQKFKVKKVKGNSALIESAVPLEEGKTYELKNEEISSDVNYSDIGFKSRQNAFSLGFNTSYIKGDTQQLTSYNIQARYGWNFSHVEFGTVGQVSFIDHGAGGTTDFSAGGYFDYNLVTNRDSKSLIYGPFVLATIGSLQSTGGANANIIDVNGGGFLSWFLTNSSAALRVEAFGDYQQVSSSAAQTSLTGFGMRGLISVYF
jgi:hypothetical protein